MPPAHVRIIPNVFSCFRRTKPHQSMAKNKIVKKQIKVSFALLAFECDFCKGEMSGGSDAYIHCNSIIKVNLSGASDLHFTGNAFTADSETSGASKIIHDVLLP